MLEELISLLGPSVAGSESSDDRVLGNLVPNNSMLLSPATDASITVKGDPVPCFLMAPNRVDRMIVMKTVQHLRRGTNSNRQLPPKLPEVLVQFAECFPYELEMRGVEFLRLIDLRLEDIEAQAATFGSRSHKRQVIVNS